MNFLKLTSVTLMSLSLAGCYSTKNNQLIPKGVQLGGGDLTFCMKGECVSAPFVDGRYAVDRPFGADDQSVAFLPLKVINGRQIYLVENREKNDSDTVYHVARLVETPSAKTGDVEAALLFCDLSAARLAKLGWKAGYAPGSCEAPNLESLTAALLDIYKDELESEDWWTKNKQPL